MIQVTDESRCSGCTACMSSCPVGSITMVEDHEGFLYPAVDESLCISCGGCVKVCPYNNETSTSVQSAFALRTPLEDSCSSGGALAYIAEKWVRNGGVVYGAAFTDSLDVHHLKAETAEDLAQFRTSKYVQSRLDECFSEIKTALLTGCKVLFIGTPCQVAGLKSFVGHSEELLTIQLACHGVPSPELWQRYLEAMEELLNGKIRKVNFRDKTRGWKRYNVAYETSSGLFRRSFDDDTYMLAYLQNLSLRPSCYDCKFRGLPYGDLAAGDLWNLSDVIPEYDDGKGFTLLAVCSERGRLLIDGVLKDEDDLLCVQVDYHQAIKKNSGFAGRISVPEKRAEFFYGLFVSDDIIGYMDGFVERKSWIMTIYAKLHTAISQIMKKISR